MATYPIPLLRPGLQNIRSKNALSKPKVWLNFIIPPDPIPMDRNSTNFPPTLCLFNCKRKLLVV